jgi:uncharacterized membrane protein
MKIFITAFLIFPLIDFVWINILMNNFYRTQIGTLLREEFLIWPAIIVYICLAADISLFVMPKAEGKFKNHVVYGFVYGLIIYGIYDMTNLATLNGWTLTMSLVDMAWGGALCSLVTILCAKLNSASLQPKAP